MVDSNTSREIDGVNGVALPAQRPPEVAVDVVTDDATPIAARFFMPATSPRGAVFVVGAMGVPQTYYAAFAGWLADEGYCVATFDFRGTYASKRGPMRDVDADILTWAEQDTQAVLRALRARAPGAPITWIGHSLGGQIVPFVNDRDGVEKIITVGTGSGYWRENSAPLRKKVWLLWWLMVPIATPLFGYFPGKRLGMVGDLPRGVIRQWRKWCLDPEYAVGDGDAVRAQFASVKTPIVSFSFTDDEMMSERNTASLHGFYTGAPRTMRRIAPTEIGVARIGHFGFFRSPMKASLWEGWMLRELATR
ncbi:MAG TPA: alpha/beta fold hydrolase [Kofleriaceae bacterium]|jgi:predicted alpha/beta hydrolase